MDLNSAALPTPCLVVDRGRFERNIARWRTRFKNAGVALRPHLKTVKSIEAARLVMTTPAGPAAVSTLKEAEVFGRDGVTDLLYAVGIAPQKLERVMRIRRSGVGLVIVTDNFEAAQAIAVAAGALGEPIPTLIEIDVDGHRSGVQVGNESELVRLGRTLHDANCLSGVMTHAGGSYGLSDAESLGGAAQAERIGINRMAEALRASNLPCGVVSIGSTPTAFFLNETDGVTEIRAGVFQFFDLYQAGVGVCSIDAISLSVLTTVIGYQNARQWTITDSGWMALSADRSTRKQSLDQHFGVVCDVEGNPHDDLVVLRTSQEHGVIAARPGSGSKPPILPVGTRLRILPNHACATAAQHDRYEVVDGGIDIRETWPRFGGW